MKKIDLKQLKSDINSLSAEEFSKKYNLNVKDLQGLSDEELATRASTWVLSGSVNSATWYG
jgi:hypothetical protein